MTAWVQARAMKAALDPKGPGTKAAINYVYKCRHNYQKIGSPWRQGTARRRDQNYRVEIHRVMTGPKFNLVKIHQEKTARRRVK